MGRPSVSTEHAIHDIAKDLLRTLIRGSHYIKYDITLSFVCKIIVNTPAMLSHNCTIYFYFLVSFLCRSRVLDLYFISVVDFKNN